MRHPTTKKNEKRESEKGKEEGKGKVKTMA